MRLVPGELQPSCRLGTASTCCNYMALGGTRRLRFRQSCSTAMLKSWSRYSPADGATFSSPGSPSRARRTPRREARPASTCDRQLEQRQLRAMAAPRLAPVRKGLADVHGARRLRPDASKRRAERHGGHLQVILRSLPSTSQVLTLRPRFLTSLTFVLR